MKLLPLLILTPLAGALVNGFLALLYAHRLDQVPRRLVGLVATLASAAACVFGIAAFLRLAGLPEGSRLTTDLGTWMASGPLVVSFSLTLDHLSAVMVLFITFVGTLIHLYSIGYMGHDRGGARYFAYLNLFLFFMLTLVVADSLPLVFLGWEGVGMCSYLLIGFWFEDPEKAAAGKKAFIVNRIGDIGFLLAMLLAFWATFEAGQPSFTFSGWAGSLDVFRTQPILTTFICLLFFWAATGKSAQIPLFVWLPDAMAGPTPVSALIHAATMVTAGVYLVSRLSFLFVLSPLALAVVAGVGASTALMAATIALVQHDIKKILAYSTVSQLGLMFLAAGAGAFSSSLFHVTTHAFFKAVLFLGAGSVIHALAGKQDIRGMGGLLRKLPLTGATFLVACLAIAGLPPLSGFFSKDELLFRTLASAWVLGPYLPRILWVMAMLTSFLTALYMFRLFVLVFLGDFRGSEEERHHLHESPPTMTIPLILLALGSAGAGFLGVPAVLGGSHRFDAWLEHALAVPEAAHSAWEAAHALEIPLLAASVGVALAGLLLALACYSWRRHWPERLAAFFAASHRELQNKYSWDEGYDLFLVRPLWAICDRFLWPVVDVILIDGAVHLLALTGQAAGQLTAWTQTGRVRTYLWYFVLGVLALALFLLFSPGRIP